MAVQQVLTVGRARLPARAAAMPGHLALAAVLVAALGLGACALPVPPNSQTPAQPTAQTPTPPLSSAPTAPAAAVAGPGPVAAPVVTGEALIAPAAALQWHEVALPGKRRTAYAAQLKDGRPALRAQADKSASMWRRKFDLQPAQLMDVRWSWWVNQPIATANIGDADQADAPVRVMFAFDGDHARLSTRTRALFDLSQVITGERPPFATLVYTWDTHAPVGSVVHNARSDRVRKIVLDSGHQGTRQWRDHRRNVAADYERVFGEAPGRLIAVALMTDGDNTQSSVESWYGPLQLNAP